MNTMVLTGLIVRFVFLLLNAIFLAIIFFTRRKVAKVGTWLSTMGTVLTSSIVWRDSGSDGGSTAYPSVNYSYQVNGQVFQGDKIAPAWRWAELAQKKVVARYPIGAQVMVFYDPQNPSDAVLEKKASSLWFLWLMLGIFDCTLCAVLPIVRFSNR